MESGEDIVVIDNTNLHAKHMKPYLKSAHANGYEVEIIRITPKSGFDAWARNQHGVPQDVHSRMQKEFLSRDVPDGIKVTEVREDCAHLA
jgi:hypothetical protein